ncbi:MAG: alcohol dehydrogenase catalytic domain-containing protein [Alphaproteobacteria bacterium]|nr:alcohol dehydrogenase catalytic domain-containing protein [Alphaproteobacteria bacterium]
MMKALLKDDTSVSVKNVAKPVLRSNGDVLICIHLAGLCRTDVFVAEGKIKGKPDLVLGHEFSGIIEAAGNDARGFQPGDKVTVMPVIPCGTCPLCTTGKEDMCQNTTMLGIEHDGAFAEYISVPAAAVYKLPENVPFDMGAYSEPVAAALSVMKSGIRPGEKGLIYGDNRFGHLIDRILKAYDFKDVTIYDPRHNTTLDESAYDFAIETMANEKIMEDIFRAVKPGGRVVLKSRKHDSVGINFNAAIKKELTLSAVNYGDFNEAIRLMAEGRLQVDDLLGDVYDLEDFAEVFERSKTHEEKKIFFRPRREDNHVRDC